MDGVDMDVLKCKRGAIFAVLIVAAALLPTQTASANPPLTGILQVSAGADHTCAYLATGYVKCWGLNSNGQLGDGTLTTRQKPPTGNGLAGFKYVVAGGTHTCGIALLDAGVWCWGSRARGQLGNGGTGGTFTKPGLVAEQGGFRSGVSAIALGAEFSCGLKDGGAKCWGRNDSGQIGNGITGTAFTPGQVTGLNPGTTKAIATGGKHACAITSTDTVKCWGLNEHGQLGATAPTTCGTPALPCAKSPVAVPGLTNVVALALGGQHSCALTASGGMKCWGSNGAGAVGNNSNADALAPVDVSGLTSGVTAIAAGGGTTCAINTANALFCWGLNTQGQVGDGTTTNRLIPTAVPGASAIIASISVGRLHACLRTTSGATKCWGENANGQLGDDSRIDLYGPFVPDPPQSVVATRGNQSATVTFAAPRDNGGFPISSYTIKSSPLTTTKVVTPATLTVLFDNLTNGQPYTFTVTATNENGGVSRPSTSAPVTPATFPGAPTITAVTAASGKATVSWTAAANNGSSISSYRVTSSPGGRSSTVVGTARKATISGLSGGETYAFRVTATNGVGPGPASAAVSKLIPKTKSGYLMLGANGTVYPFGKSPRLGSAVYASWSNGVRAAAITVRTNGTGYWIVDTQGGVRAFGTAKFLGQRPRLNPGEVISTLAATPTGKGYWLFSNRGRAVAYGDARHFGDKNGQRLNGPIIASAATPTGKGYFMVASDGGVFTFGDARFRGSTGNKRLNKPVVGLSPTPSNRGYWLVASDGGVFAFGDANFRGSMGGTRLSKPVNGLVPFGKGYLMVASDGGVFNFSEKPFFGSLGANPPAAPVIGIAAFVA